MARQSKVGRLHRFAVVAALALVVGGLAPVGAQNPVDAAKNAANNAGNAVNNAANNAANAAGNAANGAANAAGNAAGLTQAQIDQAKAQFAAKRSEIEAACRAAAARLLARVRPIVAQKNQQLAQAHQDVVNRQYAALTTRLNRVVGPPVGQTIGVASHAAASNHSAATPRSASRQGLTLTPTAPSISSLDHAAGSPDEWVMVTGSGFTQNTKACFRIGSTDTPATTQVYGDTTLICQVPHLTGIPDLPGVIYLKGDNGATSATQPFAFTALREVKIVDANWLNQSSLFQTPAGSILNHDVMSPDVLTVRHLMYTVTPSLSNSDTIGTSPLKNGWVLTGADMLQSGFDNAQYGNTTLQVGAYGTPQVNIRANWTATVACIFTLFNEYELTVYATGPVGVPYQ